MKPNITVIKSGLPTLTNPESHSDLKVGDKVKYVGEVGEYSTNVTKGKVYEINKVDANGAFFVDDSGLPISRSIITKSAHVLFVQVEKELDVVSPSKYLEKSKSVAHKIDIVALKEVAEILDDVLHREPPFIMLLKGTTDLDVTHSREQFLEHYVEYAVEAIKGLLYESSEGD